MGDAALPARMRRTKLYRTMVHETLRYLIEQVGQVDGAFPPAQRLGEDFAVRRSVGNGLEMVGLLAFRASPVWVMAALADLSGAGRELIREIADCLKKEGLLDPDVEFHDVDHILEGLEQATSRVADAVNTPPLDVAGLRREWKEIRERFRRIPPERRPSAGRIRRQWNDLKRVAREQDRSVFQVSSVMALAAMERLPGRMVWLSRSALSAGRRTGELFGGALLDHYTTTLGAIRAEGFLSYWNRQFRPYLRAAADQFTHDRPTLTERLLGGRKKR